MKHSFFLFVLIINLCYMSAFAQSNVNAIDKELAYTQAIYNRAEKIVAALGIPDTYKFTRVKNIITGQYRSLNDIYTFRDEQIKIAKIRHNENSQDFKEDITKIEQRSAAQIEVLHPKFLSALSKELTPEQIDQVKDGMTYDVVHVTYNGYNQMILTLTDEQKEQIMTWLIEAREHAMDAESSDKKHAWFGKYKGRINNYLSAAGYDLNQAGKDWEKRRNASKAEAVNK